MKRVAAFIISLSILGHAHAQSITPSSGGNSSFVPITGNATLYVNASTGSDNNNCTSSGAACATIIHAMQIAGGYSYANKYTATVNVAHGTYVGTVTLPRLEQYPQGVYPQIIGDTSSPTSVVITSSTGDALNTAAYALWSVEGFQLKSTTGTNSDLDVLNYSLLEIGYIDFAGSGDLINILNTSEVYTGSLPLTSSTTSAVIGVSVVMHSKFVNDSSTWTFNNSPTFSAEVVQLGDHSLLGAGAWSGTVTGNKILAFNNIVVEISRTSLPGSGSITENGLVSYASQVVWDTSAGSDVLDYNIGTTNYWSMYAPLNQAYNPTSFSLTGVSNSFVDTGDFTSGFYLLGSTNSSYALGSGHFAICDFIPNPQPCYIDIAHSTGNFGLIEGAVLSWATSTTQAGTSPDTGFSRLSAGVVALGNGTASDHSGTFEAAHFTATGLANSATTSAVCYNTSTGVLTYDGTVGTCTTSDERLKNIGPRIPNALDSLLKINGFYYTYKDPKLYGAGRQIGVGAQTVEKVFPELVSTDSNGIKSVAYEKLTAPIIEAMRELKADNDNLRNCLDHWQCRLFGWGR